MKKPPLWLAAAATASFWAAIYTVGWWIVQFAIKPIHDDVRFTYVAAEAGLRHGWSHIYDESTLRALSASFPAGANTIDPVNTYLHAPLFAWLFTPLTLLPEPGAYAVWTLVSAALFVVAWRIAAPYSGLANVTLLLLGLGLWPVMQAFYYGPPTFLVIALIAAAWWWCRKDKIVLAGAALAFATALKPQTVFMLPACLFFAGRFRLIAAWAASFAVLAAVNAAALGPSGISSYWQALRAGEAVPGQHTFFTMDYLFALHVGPPVYAFVGVVAAACLYIAWRRRTDIDFVFGIGVLASLLVSIHLHQPDYSNLVLAAWFVLRSSPSLAHRLWLVVAVPTLQVLVLGQPLPQLLWELGWLAILFVSTLDQSRERSTTAMPIPVRP